MAGTKGKNIQVRKTSKLTDTREEAENEPLYISSLTASALLILSSITIALFFLGSSSWLEENMFAFISMALLLGALLFLSSTYESLREIYFDKPLFIYYSIGSMAQVMIILFGIIWGVLQAPTMIDNGVSFFGYALYTEIVGSLTYGNTSALIYLFSFITMPLYALSLRRLTKITSFRMFNTAGTFVTFGSLILAGGSLLWQFHPIYPINIILVSVGGIVMAIGWGLALITFRKANRYGYV
ncbi:MAG: hypothetical protein KGH64_01400 [Candidatus Micrarchaeota archaeon]|nr:hypothetical protein [Candidatus Micrarchaeota archaeon]MDE1833972.1 hypothetical protein [Candidatus Micrarchaeota archaeon]MDE1860042.1 hypothetical protein [Candidatus Micrarchaeota archaeon]